MVLLRMFNVRRSREIRMFKPFKNQGLRVPTAIRFSFLPYLNEPVGTYGAELRSG